MILFAHSSLLEGFNMLNRAVVNAVVSHGYGMEGVV